MNENDENYDVNFSCLKETFSVLDWIKFKEIKRTIDFIERTDIGLFSFLNPKNKLFCSEQEASQVRYEMSEEWHNLEAKYNIEDTSGSEGSEGLEEE